MAFVNNISKMQFHQYCVYMEKQPPSPTYYSGKYQSS